MPEPMRSHLEKLPCPYSCMGAAEPAAMEAAARDMAWTQSAGGSFEA